MYACDLGAMLRRGQLLDQRMLGRQHDVGHAEHGVHARGEHRDLGLREAFDWQVELDAFGASDPVGLHRHDALGPIDLREIEQIVGVRR